MELTAQLGLEEKLERELNAFSEGQKERIGALAERFAGEPECLAGESDMMRLAVVARSLEKTRRIYERLGIGREIFLDTIKDVGIWCGNNQNRGLENYQWLSFHVRGELFRLGRLQFQLDRCGEEFVRPELPLKAGEPVIAIHIPQGEKLICEDCISSIRRAPDFFGKYFPEHTYRYFFCESWLLYGKNAAFMEPESNIERFRGLFDPAFDIEDDDQAIERIFGERRADVRDYPEETSLQRSAKRYMLAGNKMGMGVATIPRERFV